jgi:HlyD family secretion protein
VASPAAAPYPSYIAAAGIIEASTRNLAIATPVAGMVARVAVEVGHSVRKGQSLFMLDDRDLQAQLAVRRAALESARSRVAEAEASLGDAQSQLRRVEAVDPRFISVEEASKRRYAVQLAQARANTARAELGVAQAQVDETLANMDREVVRSPVDGQILQVNIRPGEFAPAGVLPTPLLVVGETKQQLRVRIDIDEADQWRFRPGARARAYVRGNRDFAADLTFQYVEPYIVPKVSLTGDTSQRVDTRVLQVVYSFAPEALSAYVGQQLDVFVESAGAARTLKEQGGSKRAA